MKININVNIKVGRLVRYFILSDLALLSGWGLIQPVFSVFVIQKVAGATLITVGISAAIYWILKALIQLPLANYIDDTPGEKDDFYVLILGLFIVAFSAFLFILVDKSWQLYAVQAIHAVGFALYHVSWPAIFSRHLDKDRISFDWALDSTAISIAAGVSGFLGGVIATLFGFSAVFLLAAFFSVIAAMILIMAPELILPKQTTSKNPTILRGDSATKLPLP